MSLLCLKIYIRIVIIYDSNCIDDSDDDSADIEVKTVGLNFKCLWFSWLVVETVE